MGHGPGRETASHEERHVGMHLRVREGMADHEKGVARTWNTTPDVPGATARMPCAVRRSAISVSVADATSVAMSEREAAGQAEISSGSTGSSGPRMVCSFGAHRMLAGVSPSVGGVQS